MIVKQYSILTLLLYCFVSLLGTVCLYYNCEHTLDQAIIRRKGRRLYLNRYLSLWFFVWLFLAVFRCIAPDIGGTDAITYVEYFDTCLNAVSNKFSYRTEPLFRFLTKLSKRLFNDYRWYFAFIYGTLIYGMIAFLRAYSIKTMCYWPTMVCAYLYIYSFNIVRNGWSIGVLLIAISLLKERKYIWSLSLGVISVMLHTASVFYVPFLIVFVILERKNVRSYRKLLPLLAVVMVIEERLCHIVVSAVRNGQLNALFRKLGLGQPFDVYVDSAFGEAFWIDLFKFKISRFQVIPFILLVLLYKPIRKMLCGLREEDRRAFQIIECMIMYDMMVLPAVYYFHVFRSPEYFVIGRVVFWGIVIKLMLTYIRKNEHIWIQCAAAIISMLLFIYKINQAWDMSSLMPYYLSILS